jgi:succinoglycan biosynthesis protein ExoW
VRTVSAIIPFFQRERGILTRALNSINSQHIPSGWFVEVVVVDDSSPCRVEDEIQGLSLRESVALKIIRQKNGGPGAARNRGLDEADQSASLIAFLDSDDTWPQLHLTNAIVAYEREFDFSFSDNRRELYHQSFIEAGARRTRTILRECANEDGFIQLPEGELPCLIIDEFPVHLSTLVYARSVDPSLRFNNDLRMCGEDKLFMVALATKAKRICFNARSVVECGRGVNVFFSQLEWDSPSFMEIQKEQLECHVLIGGVPGLSQKALFYNAKVLTDWRDNFAFHSIRRIIKDRGKIPAEAWHLAKTDRRFLSWFSSSLLRVIIGYLRGSYQPYRPSVILPR